jgi:hypothetical protein
MSVAAITGLDGVNSREAGSPYDCPSLWNICVGTMAFSREQAIVDAKLPLCRSVEDMLSFVSG